MEKPEIDYDKCSELINKLTNQACLFLTEKYGEAGMKRIVFMKKEEITKEIFKQMMLKDHFQCTLKLLPESVDNVRLFNIPTSYSYYFENNLFEEIPASRLRSTFYIEININ